MQLNDTITPLQKVPQHCIFLLACLMCKMQMHFDFYNLLRSGGGRGRGGGVWYLQKEKEPLPKLES